jgi:hypothetical protein
MKKLLLTLIAGATIASASSTTTINATMDLMEKGMNTIQKGFFL